MLKVLVKKEKKLIKEVTLKGHADYADHGSDIVCASASSIVITTVNGILAIKEEAIYYEENKDKVIVLNKTDDDIINKLLINMVSLLLELANDYPKNVKLIEEEYRD